MDFLDPSEEIDRHGAKLPHWEQGEAVQFVTFRLGDSLPASKLRKWSDERARWLRFHPQPWDDYATRNYHERFTETFDRWLDQGHGSCLLKQPQPRAILEETLMRDQGTRAEHHSWVIMPNHVHLLFTPKHPLEKLIKTWKGVSARRIGNGSIWQRHYRDTLIRNQRHFLAVVRYIRRNPAKLPAGSYTFWESDHVKEVP